MTFIDAQRAQMQQLIIEIMHREERALVNDMQPRPVFVACPPNIGNDPCDDCSEDDYDEWDY